MITLEKLNREFVNGEDPKTVGGERLADDGQGNELWSFGDKIANRFCAEDPDTEGGFDVSWSDDVAGWNYDPDTDAVS